MIFLASKWLKIDCVNNFLEDYFERDKASGRGRERAIKWEIIDKHITVFTVGIEISKRDRERERKTRPNKFEASTLNVLLKEMIASPRCACVRSSINSSLDFWLYPTWKHYRLRLKWTKKEIQTRCVLGKSTSRRFC